MGIATTRELDRIASALGQLQEAAPQFLHADNVCNAGVLFSIPALLSQGFLKVFAILDPLRKGYYGLLSILLVLAFMLLSRIKCPEQLKTCKVGELGKLLGLDRVPEAKCLRSKIDQIVCQRKSDELIRALSQEWIDKDDALFFYIDGHVQVYHGYQATLPKRYVSREKLCLAGTTQFWVNDELGMPYMVVTGELNEKLKTIILEQIVPELMRQTQGRVSQEQLESDPTLARFCLVFDREAYDLSFFKQLWDSFRIAVLTYRKAVKDSWPAEDFSDHQTTVIGKSVVMKLCEKTWEHNGCAMREIRKLSENGHQTSIISTLHHAAMETLAGKMLSRWSQENFFRYMVQDYDLDRMVQYGVEEVNPEKEIVNPSYKNISYRIKKEREKLARLKAKLFTKIEDDLGEDIDGVKHQMQQQSKLQESIMSHESMIEQLSTERKTIPYYMKVKDMPTDTRYNKLKTESKLFMNAIRMIAYRAETAIVNLIAPTYSRSSEEGRMLVKEIFKSDADMIPDYENKTLTLRLHSLSTPRANHAAKELCTLLNETETVYPGSDLRLIYQTVQFLFTTGQEF